jgi:hypothetical protein
MSDRFPNLGAMPSRQGHTPSLSTGAASAQAGMVRIQRGSETRYVWPVHLPGWLAIGWQVGTGEGSAAATPPATVLVTPDPQAPARTTPGISGHRPAPPVGTGRSGRAAPVASAPQPVPATTTGDSREAATPVAAQTISPPSAADSSRQPEADLTAHLPTNLLGLDQEPAGEQATPVENDAVSASNPDVAAADHPADGADAETEMAPAPGADAVVAEVNPPADKTAAEPAARRRGRPRKVRPEAQPEALTEATDQEQPPAADVADVAEAQQTSTALLSTEGDDPFGLDPLL